MKHIVILGAGTGGVLVANTLRSELNLKEWQITIIDKSDQHFYQPGLLFIPFKLYGYDKIDDIARPIKKPLPDDIHFVKADINLIDHEKQTVETSEGDYVYDWLITSLGCQATASAVEGLAKSMGNDVFTFYQPDSAVAFQQPLEDLKEGRLLINIAEMPIKCPVAPIEFAFLADYFYTLKGVRDNIDISLVTPYSGAFTKPVANKILSKTAREKRINVVPNFSLGRVDGDNKTIHSFEGSSLDYDLLCSIPPNLGPEVADTSDLGDGTGYFLTDPRTLKSRKAERVFVLGDNSNVSTSKAGSVAHFEAETVVNNLLREIRGEQVLQSFDGHANCFIETGHHKAMLLDFNYDVEPVPGAFPTPGIGPFSLLEESYLNHMGKMTFDWVYWHMLLPGYLGNMPLMTAHMNLMGKDIHQMAPIRRARSMYVKDLMTTTVVTIEQGRSLADAANLMSKHDISGLPVVGPDKKLVGILTEADFLSAMNVDAHPTLVDFFQTIILRRRAKKNMGSIVDDLMTKKPITLKANDMLQRAIEMMDRNKIKRIVITNEESLVQGIISRADLPKLFLMKG
ncbi:MAG: CBS domain-containing protein [Methylococcales bacterium]|jgi:sulfide:quinone oxidoreductase|nr:CBS domain-containing protein [Methylococcales bacterium]MBT7442598.1 CBS domain-containing protein [Methylococcales bacterium]